MAIKVWELRAVLEAMEAVDPFQDVYVCELLITDGRLGADQISLGVMLLSEDEAQKYARRSQGGGPHRFYSKMPLCSNMADAANHATRDRETLACPIGGHWRDVEPLK